MKNKALSALGGSDQALHLKYTQWIKYDLFIFYLLWYRRIIKPIARIKNTISRNSNTSTPPPMAEENKPPKNIGNNDMQIMTSREMTICIIIFIVNSPF